MEWIESEAFLAALCSSGGKSGVFGERSGMRNGFKFASVSFDSVFKGDSDWLLLKVSKALFRQLINLIRYF